MCDIVVKKFTFAISSPDEFLFTLHYITAIQLIDAYRYSISRDGSAGMIYTRPGKCRYGIPYVSYRPTSSTDITDSRQTLARVKPMPHSASCVPSVAMLHCNTWKR